MASSYTANNGIEKIGTGEQAGTWGATTNTNFDIIDRAINGVGAITLSGTTHDLTTTDGALSDGHFKVLVFGGTLSATNTVTIGPNDQDKLYFVVNSTSGSQSIIIKQGSGATVTVASGKTAIVYADGAGSGAAVAQIETGSDSFTEDLTVKTNDGALLTLQTSATEVTDGNVLGALQFQAPNEGSGTDGSAVAGAIVAEADATFTDEIASTDLVFKVGTAVATDNAAVEKMRLTHEGDLEVKAANGAILKLQNTATAITDGNVLGAIEFNAPLEDDSSDSRLTAASIVAEADATFSATVNSTDMVFKVGTDDAAVEKMRLTHEGILSIPADGSTTTNGIHIGASGDLIMFHESGDSKIKHTTGSGHFKLLGDSIALNNAAEGANLALFTAGGAAKLYFNGSEKLATSSAGVSVTGALTASGDITAFSDERLKSDIKTIDNALDKVMNMRGVSYTKQAEKGIGVIAQEVEKVLPEVVTDGEYKSVAYGNIVGVLIEAIKDLKKELDDHKQECNCDSNK